MMSVFLWQRVLEQKFLAKPYITAVPKGLIGQEKIIERNYNIKPFTYGDEYRRLRNKLIKFRRKDKNKFLRDKLNHEQCCSKKL